MGQRVDPIAIVDGTAAVSSGVPHASALVRFSEAVVSGDPVVLAAARKALREEIGEAAFVDAAAVAATFERMVRIADGTGIPLEPPLAALSVDLRRDLAINRFTSAVHTPHVGIMARALSALATPLLRMLLRTIGRLRGVRSSQS